MKKTLLGLLVVLAAPATASAGGSAGSIGIGAELDTLGLANLSGNYDFGQFHVGASFGFSDNRGVEDTLRIGARGYYHLHSTALADFGLGGELHFTSVDTGGGNDASLVEIAIGFQIRSFISTNVALSFVGGIVVGTSDSEGFSISGLPVGAAGVHYYFF
jgi:hypothetical protein